MDENGTPVRVSTNREDDSGNFDERGARVLQALLQAQRENEEKRKQLKEEFEKQKAQFEAEKAALWAATQEGIRALEPPPVNRDVNPSEIIDEEDIEESTGD